MCGGSREESSSFKGWVSKSGKGKKGLEILMSERIKRSAITLVVLLMPSPEMRCQHWGIHGLKIIRFSISSYPFGTSEKMMQDSGCSIV